MALRPGQRHRGTARTVGLTALAIRATGTAVRRLSAEHKLPETSPKPAFTLGLDK
jgi:hypothetical protein